MERDEAEIEALKKVCEQLTHFADVFGSRFQKALEAIKDNRVKKYIFKPSGRIVWIVVGRERDYLVMPAADFCPCDDFYYNVMDRKVHLCYHLIAQKLAESLGLYDKIEDSDELYDVLMREWRKVTT